MSGLKRRRTFIYLALSLMTASCTAWVLWALLGDVGPPLLVTLTVLTLLILIPISLSRWLRGLELHQNLHWGILTGAFAFLVLLVVSSGFYNSYGLFGASWLDRLVQNDLSSDTFVNQSTSLVIVAMCWWLGLKLGDLPLTSVSLVRYFYASLGTLLISSIPTTLFAYNVYRDALWLYFVFAFAALVMLGLGRVEEVARRSQDRGSPFTSYWLAHLALVAGILLGLLGIAHQLKLAYGFGLVLVIIAPVVAILAYPLVLIGAKAIALVLWLLVESSGSQVVEDPDLGIAGGQAAQTYDPTATQSVCVGLIVLAFFLIIILAFVYSARRWRQMKKDYEQEEDAALPSLGDQVSDVIQQRLERTGIRLPGLRHLRRRLATRSIRRIYAALVALGAERGFPRMVARTPYEHLRALRQAFPGCEAQVEQITEAYVAAHYGQVPETREALQQIKTAWDVVRETDRRSTPVSGPSPQPVER